MKRSKRAVGRVRLTVKEAQKLARSAKAKPGAISDRAAEKFGLQAPVMPPPAPGVAPGAALGAQLAQGLQQRPPEPEEQPLEQRIGASA